MSRFGFGDEHKEMSKFVFAHIFHINYQVGIGHVLCWSKYHRFEIDLNILLKNSLIVCSAAY